MQKVQDKRRREQIRSLVSLGPFFFSSCIAFAPETGPGSKREFYRCEKVRKVSGGTRWLLSRSQLGKASATLTRPASVNVSRATSTRSWTEPRSSVIRHRRDAVTRATVVQHFQLYLSLLRSRPGEVAHYPRAIRFPSSFLFETNAQSFRNTRHRDISRLASSRARASGEDQITAHGGRASITDTYLRASRRPPLPRRRRRARYDVKLRARRARSSISTIRAGDNDTG